MAASDHEQEFAKILALEHDIINERRAKLKRPKIKQLIQRSEIGRRPVYDTVGLALSGGGIRSTAFCLGALQALDKSDVLQKVDYLSTVSGGGYIGSSVTAGMTANGGKFPFESKLDDTETSSVKHVRDYSNYLVPRGIGDVLSSATIYLRGLAANAILIAPVLLLSAAITIFINPTISDLFQAKIFSVGVPNIFPGEFFVLTRYLLILLLAVLAGWALWRSLPWRIGQGEITGRLAFCFGLALVAVVLIAFCEMQPFMLAGMFNESHSTFDGIAAWVTNFAKILAPFSAVVALVARPLGEMLKQASESSSRGKRAVVITTKAAIYLVGLALPVILWVVYLVLCYWGILNDRVLLNSGESGYAAPAWIVQTAKYFFPNAASPIAWSYLAVGVFLVALWFILDQNANSLHRLYRDRLSKAFLFKPDTQKGTAGEPENQDQLKLSQLSTVVAPYHLINAALNLQGSRYANRRGRNADFFLFSPRFVGSSATGYVPTERMEAVVHELNLATAMAISGAAASSNMGTNTIKWLAPTLAMLNIRLGFWLRNPRHVEPSRFQRAAMRVWAHFYFLNEMFGQLDEKSWSVYLTDGGHIENLGLYELLKRRCHLIMAVDAEADPEMNFSSLIELQRHARIDLGVRIELPWREVRMAAVKTGEAPSEAGRQGTSQPNRGPHCAIGKIHYQDGVSGVLIYVKSALTGDENDYILDYRRRFTSFPHETTSDQFFSEEQFEVYRALGFHAVYGTLTARDLVAVGVTPEDRPTPAGPAGPSVYAAFKVLTAAGSGDPLVDAALKSVGLPASQDRSQPGA
jgi:hypothetical protein